MAIKETTNRADAEAEVRHEDDHTTVLEELTGGHDVQTEPLWRIQDPVGGVEKGLIVSPMTVTYSWSEPEFKTGGICHASARRDGWTCRACP